jgi:hypothetical protein
MPRQTSNRNLVPPSVLSERNNERLIDAKAAAREKQHEARCLVSLPGYQYLKFIASQILQKYECEPGKTTEQKEQWETYTQMKWALDKTFRIFESEALAAQK